MRKNTYGNAKIIPADKFFLPYQRKWIEDESSLKIMQKSRQIGLSWSTAYRCVRETALQGRLYDTWVSSRDKEQAFLFLEDCKAFAKIYKIAAEDLGVSEFFDSDGKPWTSQDIRFGNTRKIHSMSSNPNAQAGKRGTRVLDEFALHPDPRLLYSIAEPGLQWGGEMEIISTHRGTLNYFNALIEEIKFGGNPKDFSLHTVTLQDALDQGILFKIQQKIHRGGKKEHPVLAMDEADYFNFKRSRAADEEAFQQEYMCQPSDDNTAFLPYEWIDRAKFRISEDWQTDLLDCVNPLYLGMDIGRKHDLSVIWVLEKIGEFYFTRRCIELHKTPFREQERILYDLLRLRQLQRACIDASGIGAQLAENARHRFGHKVEEVQFSGPVKEELAYPLRTVFEDAAIRIPPDPKGTITADLRAVKKDTTASGNVRFTADRGTNGHADRFWALALGVHAAKTYKSAGKFARWPGSRRMIRTAERRNRAVQSRRMGGVW